MEIIDAKSEDGKYEINEEVTMKQKENYINNQIMMNEALIVLVFNLICYNKKYLLSGGYL